MLKFSALGASAVVLVVSLVAGIAGVAADRPTVVTPAENRDLYNPARAALVNARRQLAESFKKEQDILEQRQRVEKELDSSLSLLGDAQDLDPEMKAPIRDLRGRIAALQRGDSSAKPMDSKTLSDTYDRILADFEALIDHY